MQLPFEIGRDHFDVTMILVRSEPGSDSEPFDCKRFYMFQMKSDCLAM